MIRKVILRSETDKKSERESISVPASAGKADAPPVRYLFVTKSDKRTRVIMT